MYKKVQVEKHGLTIFYYYVSVDLALHVIFRYKVGKGGWYNGGCPFKLSIFIRYK